MGSSLDINTITYNSIIDAFAVTVKKLRGQVIHCHKCDSIKKKKITDLSRLKK